MEYGMYLLLLWSRDLTKYWCIRTAENQLILKVLTTHATAIAKKLPITTLQDQKTELEILKVSFDDFITVLKDEEYQQNFLNDLKALETIIYWRF